jgi:endoglucanase
MKCLFLLLSIVTLLSCKKSKSTPDPVTPPAVTDPLAKGVNLSNWFNDYSDPGQYTSRFSASSLQYIKNSGFTYVRIPVGNTILFNAANPSQLNAANLIHVDAAINKSITAGLAVTINLHPWKNDMDSLLAADPLYINKVAAYWKAVAAYFKKYSADKIFFEVYNEPHASSGGLTTQSYAWWRPVQEKMIQAIREATTDHSIIVGGEGWNGIPGLLQLQPYTDQKLIYNFHFYDPFLFTHQGATWAGWQPAALGKNIPYPSSSSAVAPLIAATTNTELKDALQWYGSQQYNIDSLDKWIKKAYDWGKENNVKLIVNEFGSYKPYAPRQSRLNWIRDVRTVFEKYKIGWAMWECDEGFGWIDYPGGNRNNPIGDNEVLRALGLQ